MKNLNMFFALFLLTLFSCGRGTVVVQKDGLPGKDGANGVNASPITVVDLCPGVSNYGTFIEIALCIDNKLYGVYSVNGGFMTYLANGSYSSNAIGSACNLTVTGCAITH